MTVIHLSSNGSLKDVHASAVILVENAQRLGDDLLVFVISEILVSKRTHQRYKHRQWLWPFDFSYSSF